jgi:hypothetical protein
MLISTLWQLTDAGLEEVKVLQTIILIVTSTDIVRHQLLAKVNIFVFNRIFMIFMFIYFFLMIILAADTYDWYALGCF